MTTTSNRPQAVLSRQLIMDALLRLMERCDFQKITINQICQEAGVARQTFYRHFKDRQEVLEQHLVHLAIQYRNMKTPSATDMVGNLITLYKEPPFSRSLLQLLMKHDLFYMLERSCMKAALVILPTTRTGPLLSMEKYDRYHVGFTASTYCCILRLWVEGGCTETPEELTALSIAFFSGTTALPK